MNNSTKPWNSDLVFKWLESRCAAARLDQAAADKRGYEARDDYDKAAAEEWVCRILKTAPCVDHQSAMADHLKMLLAQEGYPTPGIHDDQRFERYVRTNLRKLAKMTKANDGFTSTLRYQS